MNILVVGAVQFTLEMLNEMLDQNAVIVGVVTSKEAGINSDYVDLTSYCETKDIPCLRTSDINSDEVVEWIEQRSADVIFCLGWSRLIGSTLLSLTPMGVIGYHPAALPKNRGRHPLVWALVLGLKETGSTFFFMDEGADSGDILSQRQIVIQKEDDAGTLYAKMVGTARKQLSEILFSLQSGDYQRIPQDLSQASNWRKRCMKDGEIDWRMGAGSIHNLVRGLTHPYVGAHFVFRGEYFKVWKTRLNNMNEVDNLEPGRVVKYTDSVITIKCGEGCIDLLDVDPAPNFSTGVCL